MLSKTAIKNLRRTAKFILAEPRRFNMGAGVEFAKTHEMIENPPCGTACCIGGAAFIISKKIPTNTPQKFSWFDVKTTAEKFLQIENHLKLFYTYNWPDDLRKLYYGAKTAHELAAVGNLRIERYIATDGKE